MLADTGEWGVEPNPAKGHLGFLSKCSFYGFYTDKKEKKNFLIYKEIQNGAVAKSYIRKGFLIYEEIAKYLIIYEEAVSHI
jgi:hypothetical protein